MGRNGAEDQGVAVWRQDLTERCDPIGISIQLLLDGGQKIIPQEGRFILAVLEQISQSTFLQVDRLDNAFPLFRHDSILPQLLIVSCGSVVTRHVIGEEDSGRILLEGLKQVSALVVAFENDFAISSGIYNR